MAAVAPPATPQRPMPGNFAQTPAPSRPATQSTRNQLISQPVSTTQISQQLTTSSNSQLTPIERASKTVNDYLDRDRRYPELERYIAQGISHDYEDSNNPAWNPYQKIKNYEIPDRILDQYNLAQTALMMGLFAELNHAWIAIDNALYLWDFTHPNPDLVGFEDQPHAINAVKLLKPRPGVFVKTIEYVLVVATSADIILIGVSFERGPMGVQGITLYQTNMKVPVKAGQNNIIAGSDRTGRIFFAGAESDDVHELTYQQEEKWFSNRCGKINHVTKPFSTVLPSINLSFGKPSSREHVREMMVDDSRNLLYTLSSTSTIRIFQLKENGILDLSLTLSISKLKTSISHIQNTTELLQPGTEVASICPIPSTESPRLSLIATMSTGHRVFLSATSGGIWGSSNQSSAPTSMQPHHIKAPPPTVPSARLTYRFGSGYFLCFFRRPNMPDIDVLLASAPDTGRLAALTDQMQASKFIENAQTVELGSFVSDVGMLVPAATATSTPQGYGNELAIQFDKPVCELAILTNTGVQIIRRRRLVDVFAAIIRYGGTPEEGVSGELKKFARLYGRDETSATALAVACGQGTEVTSDLRVAKVSDTEVLEQARKAFIDLGGKAVINETSIDQAAPTIDNVRPSSRHGGLAIYIARVVRSIWKSTIIQEIITTRGIQVEPAVPLTKTQDVQRDLIALKEFLDSNKSFIDGLAGPEALSRINSKSEELALQGEHRALNSLVVLIANIIEGMAFVQMLFDEKVDEILIKLSDASRQKVRELTFETLFCKSEGRELAKELVKAIVNRNIEKGSNVDTVAEALRRRCGSFCSADDVVIFKAQEQLKKASEAGPTTDKARALLNDSLKLFGKVSASLSMEHLIWAVRQYTELGFYAGAIHLSLEVASTRDPGKKALSWLRDGQPSQDPRKAQYDTRTRCYELIKSVIIAVDTAVVANPIAVDGQISAMGRRYNEAHDEISRSDDEVFQNYLFDWYLETGKIQNLLDDTSPFVATYLKRKSQGSAHHADLLWRYFARHHEFFKAAEVQVMLAKSDFTLNLQQRVEYLSKAKANASTRLPGIAEMRTSRNSRQELLREASELLDLADIQAELVERLQADIRYTPENKESTLKDLDGQVKSINELFNGIADPAGYWDICLLIYASADYRVAQDIEQTWHRYVAQLDRDVEEQKKWELFPSAIRAIGRKLRTSEAVFSVPFLLPLFMKYHVDKAIPAPPTWMFQLFLYLEISAERVVTVLEWLFSGDEPGWSAPEFRRLAGLGLLHVIDYWYQETSIGDVELFGDDERAASVADILRAVVSSGVFSRNNDADAQVLDRLVALREQVESWLR
ncbi:non-repetitive nucleoporin [Pseudovirgaria hyperparasitica]|uniref:Non-repetitive nucleoporin n=1 Tax=Pseudovirgaria hyperparasitica TaxID=470096 RepID=A0A6A6WLL7_9PEZI|nr:non-repetitive nucleoporin [Pseudovirgaria hyperparasitica]KAF2763081.1 non-repetitive nucleoporin [Pseudovirgaria hyperparasitica]